MVLNRTALIRAWIEGRRSRLFHSPFGRHRGYGNVAWDGRI